MVVTLPVVLLVMGLLAVEKDWGNIEQPTSNAEGPAGKNGSVSLGRGGVGEAAVFCFEARWRGWWRCIRRERSRRWGIRR